MNYDEIKSMIENLLAVPHCAPEVRDAATAYLASINTENEKICGKAFVQELEDAVMPIDAVISFFKTDDAIEKFGKESAKAILDSSIEAKKAGAVYCGCDACKAGEALLKVKDFFL